MPAGIAYLATIRSRRLTYCYDIVVALIRMHMETYPLASFALERTELKRMQAGCSRARIDLGFDRRQRQVDKVNPLSPSERDLWGCACVSF
jgi:hypothetical protein